MFGELIALVVTAILFGVLINMDVVMFNDDNEIHEAVMGMAIFFTIIAGIITVGLAVDICQEMEMPRVETTVKPHVDSTTTIKSNPPDTTTIYLYDFNPERKRDARDQE